MSMPVPHAASTEAAHHVPGDGRAPARLARSTYRDLRASGLSDTDIMAFAGELLSLVATGVRSRPGDG